MNPHIDNVLSIDPGTRNLAFCLLRYETVDPNQRPETLETFLRNITLVNWGHNDFHTIHINTVSVRCLGMMQLYKWARARDT